MHKKTKSIWLSNFLQKTRNTPSSFNIFHVSDDHSSYCGIFWIENCFHSNSIVELLHCLKDSSYLWVANSLIQIQITKPPNYRNTKEGKWPSNLPFSLKYFWHTVREWNHFSHFPLSLRSAPADHAGLMLHTIFETRCGAAPSVKTLPPRRTSLYAPWSCCHLQRAKFTTLSDKINYLIIFTHCRCV